MMTRHRPLLMSCRRLLISRPKSPDTTPPVLDVNRITIEAEPTNPAAPNGETQVDITFRVKDNISGYSSTDMFLRDPQGVEHFF